MMKYYDIATKFKCFHIQSCWECDEWTLERKCNGELIWFIIYLCALIPVSISDKVKEIRLGNDKPNSFIADG